MKVRELICIGCPLGCRVEVKMEGDDVVSVTGNSCKNGDKYARKEVTNPTRIVTGTVRVSGSKTGVVRVSCKTASDVPKDKIFKVVKELKGTIVPCPVRIGDVVKKNAAGTGVDVVATKQVC